MKKTKAAIAWP